MPKRLIYDAYSVQNQRESNMDSVIIRESGSSSLIAVVCDGVGSLASGDFASAQAALGLVHWYKSLEMGEGLGLKMKRALIEINDIIVDKAKELGLDTASTLSSLLIVDENYYIVHIGDSRIYSWKPSTGLQALTTDFVSEDGKLNGYVGKRKGIFPEYLEGSLEDCVFLLCSDGFYKRAEVGELTALVEEWDNKQKRKVVENFIETLINRGERDNISCALVKIR